MRRSRGPARSLPAPPRPALARPVPPRARAEPPLPLAPLAALPGPRSPPRPSCRRRRAGALVALSGRFCVAPAFPSSAREILSGYGPPAAPLLPAPPRRLTGSSPSPSAARALPLRARPPPSTAACPSPAAGPRPPPPRSPSLPRAQPLWSHGSAP